MARFYARDKRGRFRFTGGRKVARKAGRQIKKAGGRVGGRVVKAVKFNLTSPINHGALIGYAVGGVPGLKVGAVVGVGVGLALGVRKNRKATRDYHAARRLAKQKPTIKKATKKRRKR